jgi:hypothetical protein
MSVALVRRRGENSRATGVAAMVAVDGGMATIAPASDSRPRAARSLHGAAAGCEGGVMQKSSPSSVEEARQQRMTSYLSLVALVLAGLLVLALAERYL